MRGKLFEPLLNIPRMIMMMVKCIQTKTLGKFVGQERVNKTFLFFALLLELTDIVRYYSWGYSV